LKRVTGAPLRLPHQFHSEQYAYTPVFLFQEPASAPVYRNEMFRSFHLGWQAHRYREQQSLAASFESKRRNLEFFVTPLLMVPLLTFAWMLRSRKTRFAVFCVALVFGASLAVSGGHAHYIAPVAPMLFLLVVQGLRQVAQWRPRGFPLGRWLVGAIVAAHVAIFCVIFATYRSLDPPAWALRRAALQSRLEGLGGRHLVVVHYFRNYSPHDEWVWNAADLEGAPVVWARSLGEEADARLLDHFADRRIWELHPGRGEDELREITAPEEGAGAP